MLDKMFSLELYRNLLNISNLDLGKAPGLNLPKSVLYYNIGRFLEVKSRELLLKSKTKCSIGFGIQLFVGLCILLGSGWTACAAADEAIYLRDNLGKARRGDYIVTMQNKTYCLLHIYDKEGKILTIEEIAIPSARVAAHNISWKDWVAQGAPGQTSWVMYAIDLNDARMIRCYSFSKNCWLDMPQKDNFLSTLLNLRLQRIPYEHRRKVGANVFPGVQDKRAVWQPRLVVDGVVREGVYFDAFKTNWPKDGSELSGKTVEVYVPEEGQTYPCYFPYWLQISGMIGKAKIRIVDSGSGMASPARMK